MANDLDSFHADFQQQIHLDAQAGEMLLEDAFLEHCGNVLQDAGELVTFDAARFDTHRGIRIDGYGGDPIDADGVLSLVIADFDQGLTVRTLTQSDMNKLFKRATNFLEKCLDEEFRFSMDETDAAFGLADLINARWRQVSRVRIILVTNRVLSRTVDSVDAAILDNRRILYNVWDISRLFQFESTGQEEIEIDLEDEFGGALPAIAAHLPTSTYTSYLLVIPGSQLAAIYDRWGTRLLEQNVRVFLQARGNVNKGIRNTLDNDPEMFFAYNNGITATASAVITEDINGVLHVTALRDFQIVNGGQTTASIHAASNRKDVDLSKVFVQVKLSVVGAGRSLDVVPKISEYANSQNRVNAADFFSNHPFHIRMERFSRLVMAPSQDGTLRPSKWFYERARGQFADARGKLTPAAQKRFDVEYPRAQQFNKTDLAKYENVWKQIPHIVSRGAQKNFAHYAQEIGTLWEKDEDQFNEQYFQQLVAKAIIFKETERLVSRQPWYEGGYRANIVAYTIAKMAHEVQRLNAAVNFEMIWKRQAVPAEMQLAIVDAARVVNDVIVNPPAGQRNISEWAKQQACWAAVERSRVAWPKIWLDSLISKSEAQDHKRHGKREQQVLKGIDAQTAVVTAGKEFWSSVAAWGASRKLLDDKDMGILTAAITWTNRPPSELQSRHLVSMAKRLASEGCVLCERFQAL
jgi:hypothetical protein